VDKRKSLWGSHCPPCVPLLPLKKSGTIYVFFFPLVISWPVRGWWTRYRPADSTDDWISRAITLQLTSRRNGAAHVFVAQGRFMLMVMVMMGGSSSSSTCRCLYERVHRAMTQRIRPVDFSFTVDFSSKRQ
jgi:hypothetical protein